MTKGVKLLILLLVGILGIALILYFFLFRGGQGISPDNSQKTTPQSSLPIAPKNVVIGKDPAASFSLPPTTTTTEGKILDGEDTGGKRDLARFVFSFVERFGSFSSESEYQNIRDLEIFMMKAMKDWAEQYISEKNRTSSNNAQDYRITTKALVVKESEILEGEGQATFLITTQRNEIQGNEKKIFYQDIEVSLLRLGDVWKVESAYWK